MVLNFALFLAALAILLVLPLLSLLWVGELRAFRSQRRRALFHVFHCNLCQCWVAGPNHTHPCPRCGRTLDPLSF